MSNIISVINFKGGSGKTTVSVNLSTTLAYHDKRVLLIDLDSQMNATISLLRAEKWESIKNQRKTIYYLLEDIISDKEVDINNYIIQNTLNSNLDLLPSDLSLIKYTGDHLFEADLIFSNLIREISNNYDYIILDCPPSFNIFSKIAMLTSDFVIIPIMADFLSQVGLGLVFNAINKFKSEYNSKLKVIGILINNYRHTGKSNEIRESIKHQYGNLVFDTIIPSSIEFQKAVSEAKPIYFFKKSLGSVAFKNFSEELINRIKNEGFEDE